MLGALYRKLLRTQNPLAKQLNFGLVSNLKSNGKDLLRTAPYPTVSMNCLNAADTCLTTLSYS